MFLKKGTIAIWRVPYTWSKYFLKPSLLQCTSSCLWDELAIKNLGPKICKLMVNTRKKPFDFLNKQTTCKTKLFKISASWSWSVFSKRQKTFMFTFYNTILGINTRTSHFGLHVTGNCCFCSRKNPPENNDETFYTCSFPGHTSNWNGQCLQTCLPEVGFLTLTDKKNCGYWGCLGTAFLMLFLGLLSVSSSVFGIINSAKKVPFFHTLFAEFISLFWETCCSLCCNQPECQIAELSDPRLWMHSALNSPGCWRESTRLSRSSSGA